jgi:DnaJ family protein C protein 27
MPQRRPHEPAVRDFLRIKVLSMGDGHTGKSCLIKRYCEQRVRRRLRLRGSHPRPACAAALRPILTCQPLLFAQFVTKYIATIGVDFGVRSVAIDNTEVKVNFWDLSGHPEFFDVRNEFYKDTQGAILVYDVGSKRSFESLDGWLKEASKYGAKDIKVVVCANKVDGKKRAVSLKDGQAWAVSKGYEHFETSASAGTNVEEVFQCLFSQVVAAARQ